MSQKPFIWNGNNPVEWSDPTGYYTFAEDQPPEQEREFEEFAARLDKQVVDKLSDKNLSPTQRQGLELLHQDLQKGQGSWVISFGPTRPTGTDAQTFVNVGSNGFQTQAVRDSVFNTLQLNKEMKKTPDAYLQAIATEGGTYEIDSGRMGAQLQGQAFDIYTHQKSGPLGNLTNEYFTHPLGLGRDVTPSIPNGSQ